MFIDELKAAAEKFNIELNDNQLEKFDIFYDLVVEWNNKVNLTAITDPSDFAIKHIIDSISIWNDDKFQSVESMIDVGTGAGFPGIPLKIYRPHIKVTLLDSLAKRINFLRAAVDLLQLENVELIHSRAEDAAHSSALRETFDLAVSRAVARLNILAEYCVPFVRVHGYFAALKGSNIKEELQDAKGAVKLLGGKDVECIKIILPNDNERNLIYIKKASKTVGKYPRKAGVPERKPLK
ncbi:MAG: 16S rRNA (guanine(527)-N(7))-methyltransferase RsmG [Selenomonadaceae bacterium]|nr:16S rRNA (guanine(527)-N(7))-methyltransferase RsmG [Selenomonadaceae bacterium]